MIMKEATVQLCFKPGDVLWILPAQYRRDLFPDGFPMQVDAIAPELPAPSDHVVVHGRILNAATGATVGWLTLPVWLNQPYSVRVDPPAPRPRHRQDERPGPPSLARPYVDSGRLHAGAR